MLARLQQAVTLGLLAAALAWLAWFHPTSPVLALAGFLAIVLGYAAFLAIEFIAIKLVNARDPAPAPRWGQVLAAWWGETLHAPVVFCWRQPFRSNAVPDHVPTAGAAGKRGVVLVHGFVCNRGFWTPWLARLQSLGHPFVAVNLEPVFGSIDDYPPLIDAAVRRITASTGQAPVLVCHSMGGLAARAWLRVAADDARVHHVVTIGTPHGGTWLGRLSHLTNGRQMRLAGPWINELTGGEPAGRSARFTCWYSNCDNIVFPTSTATLAGAQNRFVPGIAHVALAFCPRVVDATFESLRFDRW